MGEGQRDGVGRGAGARAWCSPPAASARCLASTTNPRVSTGDGVAVGAAGRRGGAPTWSSCSSTRRSCSSGADAQGQQPLVSRGRPRRGRLPRRRRRRAVHGGRARARRAGAARRRRQGDHATDARERPADTSGSTRAHLGDETWRARFPTILESLPRTASTRARDLIPVAPALPLRLRRRAHRPRRPQRRCRVCSPAARWPAPACTGRTGSRPTRCSRGSCSPSGSPRVLARLAAPAADRWPLRGPRRRPGGLDRAPAVAAAAAP